MACTSLCCIGNGGCVEAVTNGADGTVMTVVAGVPQWATATAGTNITTTSGVGAPAATVGAPTIYVDTATGDTYFRDSTGVVTLIDDPISTTSGVVPPTATLNDPVIYTDTATSIVYFRDDAGNITQLSSTFDVTAGPDAVTVVTGPITVTPGDKIHFWGNTIDFSVVAGSAVVQTEHKPIARINRISKIGLVTQYDAVESAGNTLTYAWAYSNAGTGTGTATFSSLTAVTPIVTFSAPGQYNINLTVTDASGNTDFATYPVKVDRVIEVNGADFEINDLITKLQDAFDFITTNDAANETKYVITVHGTTEDIARITPNQASVVFESGATLPIGVDFGSGTFKWVGNSGNILDPAQGIVSAAGIAVTGTAGTNLRFDNMTVVCTDATAAATISLVGVTRAQLYNTFVSANGGPPVSLDINGATAIVLRDCRFNKLVKINGGTQPDNAIEGCYFNPVVAETVGGLSVTDYFGYIRGCTFRVGSTSAPEVYCVSVSAPISAASITSFTHNHLYISSTSTGAGIRSAIKILAGAGAGKLLIHHNAALVDRATIGAALHMVGAPPADLYIANNVLETGSNAVLSSSDSAGLVALAWNNAPLYNNVINGLVTNTTIIAGTLLNGGNVQV